MNNIIKKINEKQGNIVEYIGFQSFLVRLNHTDVCSSKPFDHMMPSKIFFLYMNSQSG